jgi:lysozyme
MTSNQKINSHGLTILEKCEGLRLKAYKDIRGIWTIGYGHTGKDVREGLFITQDGAEMLLGHDLEIASEGVNKLVTVPLTSNEFSALVCLVYNIGLGAFAKSTLLRYLNQGQRSKAAEQFLEWDKAGGERIAGLTARRAAERALFLA